MQTSHIRNPDKPRGAAKQATRSAAAQTPPGRARLIKTDARDQGSQLPAKLTCCLTACLLLVPKAYLQSTFLFLKTTLPGALPQAAHRDSDSTFVITNKLPCVSGQR